MVRKYTNIISLFLLVSFIMPAITRVFHHHDHKLYKTNTEKNLQAYHAQCAVCSFEFSTFLSEKINTAFEKVEFADNYNCCLNLFHFSDLSKFSFLLRGPPVFANNI
jgi:hypothetical protein